MKPALYYAIRRNLYKDIVAVTSEKGGRLGVSKWAGRYVSDNTPTHGDMHGTGGLMGRFETQEAAEAKRSELKKISDEFEAKRELLNNQLRRLWREESAAIEAACNV